MSFSQSGIQALQNFSPKPDLSVQSRLIKQSEISGTVIIFDLVASTELKLKKQFPIWVPDLEPVPKLALSATRTWRQMGSCAKDPATTHL